MLTSILSAVIIFGVLVVVHEAGHFAMAKRLGVRVIRFSVGYPPKIWGIRRGETEYALGATPLGGYCRMLGDEVGEERGAEEIGGYLEQIGLDIVTAARAHGLRSSGATETDELLAIAERLYSKVGDVSNALSTDLVGRELKSEEALLLEEIHHTDNVETAIKNIAAHPPRTLVQSYESRSFPTQPLWKRVLIVLAGPASNIVFAPVLLTLVFMLGVPIPLAVIGEVQKGTPAAAAGLREGDVVVSINGKPVDTWEKFSDTVRASNGAQLDITLKRKVDGTDTLLTIPVKPMQAEQTTPTGSKVAGWIVGVKAKGDYRVQRYGPLDSVSQALAATVNLTGQLVVGIASIISGATPVREALGGPIRIAQMAGQYAHQGFADLAMFTVMLSIELGIINLLPVPLLDGGHLLFFVFEGVRGKPLELRYREMMLQVGLFLLVALMAFVIFNDISRIVQG
jgi:regulator of sigma E protease